MSDAIDYCKGCPTQVMCHTERRCMKPSDPMTEGEERGTPYHCEIYAQGLQDPHCLVGPDGIVCRIGCQEDATFMRDLEPVMDELNRKHATLTEALKVAGELADSVDHKGKDWASDPNTRDRIVVGLDRQRFLDALAALERIRNNKH